MIRLTITRDWRVDAAGSVDLPTPAAAVWSVMRDLERFLTADPLHARVLFRFLPHPSRTFLGARMVIQHRFLGLGPDRLSTVLTWREGHGFSVSDLSSHGVRAGFPHICTFEVQPLSETASRLTIGARGRWTATWVPRPLIRLWLWWVIRATEHSVRRLFVRPPVSIARQHATLGLDTHPD